MDDERVTPTPENPIPDVDEIKPGIPDPAWDDEGGGLPVASASNEGQALTSTKKYVKGAVIVPQQTVTLDENSDAELSNTNKNLFTIGTRCFVVVGDTEYKGTVYENSSEYNTITVNDNGIEFWINDSNEFWYYNEDLQEGDESTVAIYVAEPSYSWEPNPYAGYDIIFQVKSDPDADLPLNEITVSVIEIVNGSIEALEQKLLNGERVNGLFEMITSYSGNGYDTYKCWQMTYFDVPYRVISFGRSSINGASSYTILTLLYKSDYTLENITFGS